MQRLAEVFTMKVIASQKVMNFWSHYLLGFYYAINIYYVVKISFIRICGSSEQHNIVPFDNLDDFAVCYFNIFFINVMLLVGQMKDFSYQIQLVSLAKQKSKKVFYTTDGMTLVESMAIIQYLEDTRPQPTLMPKSPLLRAQARVICEVRLLFNQFPRRFNVILTIIFKFSSF